MKNLEEENDALKQIESVKDTTELTRIIQSHAQDNQTLLDQVEGLNAKNGAIEEYSK